MKRNRPTTDAVEILHRRYYAGKPKRLAGLDAERVNAQLARELRALRTKAGLSQRALAKLVGTTASVICRLEDADYDGPSLAILRRIARVLERRVDVRFLPLDDRSRTKIPSMS